MAPLPDIDRRITSLAVAVLCALGLAYLAYVLAERANRRARMADDLAAEAHRIAVSAYSRAIEAQAATKITAPRRVKRSK